MWCSLQESHVCGHQGSFSLWGRSIGKTWLQRWLPSMVLTLQELHASDLYLQHDAIPSPWATSSIHDPEHGE